MSMLASVLGEALRAAQAAGDGKHDTLSIADLSLKLMLTEKEAAAYSGLSLADIERARASVKAIKTGAGWRVKREELERYVKKL
jgi:excisionase family DNA binding protein